MEKVQEKLLRYIKINTKSDPASETIPSTINQFDLAKLLVEELLKYGVNDAYVDEHCYVMGTLKGNCTSAPTIGLIAHMDTSPDMSGENVKPKIIENYNGKDIVLNEAQEIVMRVSDFPYLTKYIGKTLITTDGTTLLGADNKAGIAEIMSVVEFFYNNADIKRGDIKIGFTPDEEIGRGADKFDVKKFGADFAYTLDGSFLGEIEYENFNAASATVVIKGLNIHPGSAKHKMINSMLIAMELQALLPVFERPEFTEGYEGFIMLNDINGNIEKTTMKYIIRDHDIDKFEKKKNIFKSACDFLNLKYSNDNITFEINDSYYNMKQQILPVIHIVESAVNAMNKLGIKPNIKAIRGGTDGSRLSYMGLPTPNLFTGGFNYHGRYESIAVEDMNKVIETVIEIIKSYAEKL